MIKQSASSRELGIKRFVDDAGWSDDEDDCIDVGGDGGDIAIGGDVTFVDYCTHLCYPVSLTVVNHALNCEKDLIIKHFCFN